MSLQLTRLLRVRRLMEEMSRVEFAHRRAEQMEMETRREAARETALALRGEARTVIRAVDAERDAVPGLWQRYLADSERSAEQVEQWDRIARQAAARTNEAERKYLDDRKGRMQTEILVREKMAAKRVEQERREQREIDDWFGMGRGRRRLSGAR